MSHIPRHARRERIGFKRSTLEDVEDLKPNRREKSSILRNVMGCPVHDSIFRPMEKAGKTEGTRKFLVTNESGLHARPVSELVRCAMRFKSEITISANGKKCSAVSIMDLMTADIRRGAEISVTAEGIDAEKALDAIGKCLAQLAEKGF